MRTDYPKYIHFPFYTSPYNMDSFMFGETREKD